MALSTTEITDLRELLKEKYTALLSSKTDTQIDTLISYGDTLINDNCKIRKLAIEYWVAFTVDTESDATVATGATTSVEIGDVKTSFSNIDLGDSVYAGNLYGRLYLQVMKDCSKMFVGIIA